MQAQFPVLRLQELYTALSKLASAGDLTAMSAYDAVVNVLDQNTERIGSLCDIEGCGKIVEQRANGMHPFPMPSCPEHGWRPLGACRLVVAWKPIDLYPTAIDE